VVAAAIVLTVALLIGLLNGILITRFGIDSFIATMGLGTLLYGISNWYSGGAQITGSNLPASFTNLSEVAWHVPLPALYVAIAALVLWAITERLPVGRSLYVIGASMRAAELLGIRTKRYITAAFMVSGLLSGVSGIMLGSILETGTPSVGPEYLLPAFAATLLGATSIHPGRVNVVGTLLAVLILAFSFSGVQQLGAPFYVQYFFNGGILIVAVGLSVYAAARRRALSTVNASKLEHTS
jgi:ribose transport system permease protein